MKPTTIIAATTAAMIATGVSAKDIDLQSYIPGTLLPGSGLV